MEWNLSLVGLRLGVGRKRIKTREVVGIRCAKENRSLRDDQCIFFGHISDRVWRVTCALPRADVRPGFSVERDGPVIATIGNPEPVARNVESDAVRVMKSIGRPQPIAPPGRCQNHPVMR